MEEQYYSELWVGTGQLYRKGSDLNRAQMQPLCGV
jgi:hypothetical protein